MGHEPALPDVKAHLFELRSAAIWALKTGLAIISHMESWGGQATEAETIKLKSAKQVASNLF